MWCGPLRSASILRDAPPVVCAGSFVSIMDAADMACLEGATVRYAFIFSTRLRKFTQRWVCFVTCPSSASQSPGELPLSRLED
ncbi:hypothetical protein BD309DRAFT_254297 [Dichomitus squalens]|nr:hypothetical protein BD309DRAFT_254297 [Dichomitus squalens]